MPLADLIDDVFELLGVGEPAEGVDRELEGLILGGTGGPPSCPATTSTFCPWMAFSTSRVVSPKVCRRFGSSQTRML